MVIVAANLKDLVVSGSFFISSVVCNFQNTSQLCGNLDYLVVVVVVMAAAVVVVEVVVVIVTAVVFTGVFTELCIQHSVAVTILK